jgi:mRNA-degrading endonuclease RelE of RelBE toxin-antitoxin system
MYALSVTEQFHRDYKRLEQTEQRAIKRALERLRDDIDYPSLRVKKMSGREEVWEARASRDLRITFMFQEPETLLFYAHAATTTTRSRGKQLKGSVLVGFISGLFTILDYSLVKFCQSWVQ